MKVSKELMLEGFCLLRQAERSLDHVLFDDWHELVFYYNENREKRILDYTRQLAESLLDWNTTNFNREALGSRLRTLPCLLNSFRLPFQAKKNACHLRQDEISFLHSTLGTMLSMLSGDRPADTDIIRLRMDASLCQSLILMRCGTLPRLEKANMVENFDMPEHKRHYAIEEIIFDQGVKMKSPLP